MWLKLPVDVEEPEIEEAVEILKPLSKAPLTATCAEPEKCPATASYVSLPVIEEASPLNLVTSIVPNEPVEDAEPLISPLAVTAVVIVIEAVEASTFKTSVLPLSKANKSLLSPLILAVLELKFVSNTLDVGLYSSISCLAIYFSSYKI